MALIFGGLYLWIICILFIFNYIYIHTHIYIYRDTYIHTLINDTHRQFFSPVHWLPPFLHPALNCEANLRPQAKSSK